MVARRISALQWVERTPDLVHATVADEAVMMSIARGEYYSLNAVGARIWDLLDSPMNAEQLCQRLCAEYEIGESECRDQLSAFLGELLDLGILRTCPDPRQS